MTQRLIDAAQALLDACEKADGHEELSEHIDGSLLDELSASIEQARSDPIDPILNPMETAPLDGTEVLLKGINGCYLVGHHIEGGHCIEDHPPVARGWYFWNGCMFDQASKPVGWLPIPPKEWDVRELKMLRTRIRALEGQPEICCEEFETCLKPCVPLVHHWREKAKEQDGLLDWLEAHKSEATVRLTDMTFKTANVWAISAHGNDLRAALRAAKEQIK